MRVVSTGLFVGVDDYTENPGLQLRAGIAGARRLRAFLAECHPGGLWRVLPDNADVACSRSVVLVAVHEWLVSLHADAAGVLYFGGHGLVVRAGMVLFGRDCNPRYATDTGIPLWRIFELVKQLCPRSRLVLLLDACRSCEADYTLDDVPPNLTVVFACQPGCNAEELNSSSVFVDAFMNAITQCHPTSRVAGQSVVSLETILERVDDIVDGHVVSEFQRIDVVGSRARDLGFVWARRTARSRAVPRAFLRSRKLHGPTRESHQATIQVAVQEWLGPGPVAPSLDSVIQHHSDGITSVLVLGGTVTDASEFISYLSIRCASLFYELTIDTGRGASSSVWRPFALRQQAAMTRSGDSIQLVSKAGQATGLMHVARDGDNPTRGTITVQSSEAQQLPLETCLDWIERCFRFAAVVPGGVR